MLERYFAHFGDRAILERVPDDYEIYPRLGGQDGSEPVLPVGSLTEVLRIGVEHPKYGFTHYTYTNDGLRSDLHRVHVRFTPDGKVIFGIAMADTGEGSYACACQIRDEMILVTQAHKAFIGYKYPPSNDEAEFDADMIMWQNIGDA
ncbi:hypothetical protein FY528_14630 [Hymenobacter lutimineralis]|uniref:Uncharacterized protein n=1 Tax=Hymenobacter lutimineralis TaxID=2606448 RepID=A0A5D6UX39_9BACT|nr:hypothetical protein [Hymenobacter lutimineralis]TYZ07595.1 hypothetical protein FY528_14630 [Hymenobacter lutimineralis]